MKGFLLVSTMLMCFSLYGTAQTLHHISMWPPQPRAKPFTQLKNLQLVFELSPYVNKNFVGRNLRSRLGIAWNFTNSSSKRN
jgi:hypothetical protein